MNENKLMANATEIVYGIKDIEAFYDSVNEKYYFGVDDFIYENKDVSFENLPKILWLCTKEVIKLDASCIVENACEELHEDAYDNCDIDELQMLLNEWCKKQSGAITYYPNYNEYIIIKEEWFEEISKDKVTSFFYNDELANYYRS